jgi:peptidoglycan hydrolase CwlO-like protein
VRSEHRSTCVARATIPIVALFVVGLMPSAAARADTATELSSANAQLDAVVAEISGAAQQRDALQADLTGLLSKLDANGRAIDEAQAGIDRLVASIGVLVRQIDLNQAALDLRAAEAYTTGPASGLSVLLGATSLADLQDRIQMVDAAARSDAELIAGLSQQKNTLHAQQTELLGEQTKLREARGSLTAQANTLSADLAAQQAVVAALDRDRADAEALVSQLQSQRDRELAQQRIKEANGSSSGGSGSGGSGGGGPPPPPPSPPPPPPPPGSGSVQDMIRSDFGSLGQANVDIAMCVADRESNFDPSAENPNTGAAGVFQFMPSTWASLAPAAGYGGASAFDAEANVGTAAWTVQHYGWSAWSGDGPYCGF